MNTQLELLKIFEMPPHPSTNSEMQKCYQNELKSNGVKGSLHNDILKI